LAITFVSIMTALYFASDAAEQAAAINKADKIFLIIISYL
jgi:hypothetical protein